MPRTLLASARVPDTDRELRLYRNGSIFSILMPGSGDLMNSHTHGSEQALAELACARMAGAEQQRVLVGGLGMGFTLAAALAAVGPQAQVVVAELVPEVVDWNRQWTGEPAGHPLRDARTVVHLGDVRDLLVDPGTGFDAILLDVDNGPQALLRRANDWLYASTGLAAARQALRPGGVLALWSAAPHAAFVRRLQHSGFSVEEHVVRAHRPGGRAGNGNADGNDRDDRAKRKRRGKGARHYIWLAT